MLEHMPGNSIVIVGAGYISVEFASIFRGFGADVHLMFRKPLPLTGCASSLLPECGLLVHAAHLCRKHPSPGCLLHACHSLLLLQLSVGMRSVRARGPASWGRAKSRESGATGGVRGPPSVSARARQVRRGVPRAGRGKHEAARHCAAHVHQPDQVLAVLVFRCLPCAGRQSAPLPRRSAAVSRAAPHRSLTLPFPSSQVSAAMCVACSLEATMMPGLR